jgi:Response regulator containing CheY-like receiver, AAA-type ATPase, and DNA-binding domains
VTLNILIIENENIVALDLKLRLSLMGYNIVGAVPSGEEALNIIKNNVVDLVLMDAYLDGELDGIDTAMHIRTDFDTPIIYISASFNLEKHEKIELTEPYEYIKKPFDNDQLQLAINNSFKN